MSFILSYSSIRTSILVFPSGVGTRLLVLTWASGNIDNLGLGWILHTTSKSGHSSWVSRKWIPRNWIYIYLPSIPSLSRIEIVAYLQHSVELQVHLYLHRPDYLGRYGSRLLEMRRGMALIFGNVKVQASSDITGIRNCQSHCDMPICNSWSLIGFLEVKIRALATKTLNGPTKPSWAFPQGD